MIASSPLMRALGCARPDVPDALVRFDRLVRAGACAPSFEEYSARIGEELTPWRQTCYFDVADPQAGSVAGARLLAIAAALGFALPERFVRLLQAGIAGPEVLQVVLGYDAGDGSAPARLKYYLVFQSGCDALVERVRLAVGGPALPPTLAPSTVYILGLDFTRAGLHDLKIYVRLDPRRLAAVIANLDDFARLRRGSRYVVFQRCLVSGGQQVYFHLAAAAVLEAELERRAAGEPAAAELRAQVTRMNAALPGPRWRPWIASYPLAGGLLRRTPSNLYFHLEEGARDTLGGRASQDRTGRG